VLSLRANQLKYFPWRSVSFCSKYRKFVLNNCDFING
jgi:hypothetical protein